MQVSSGARGHSADLFYQAASVILNETHGAPALQAFLVVEALLLIFQGVWNRKLRRKRIAIQTFILNFLLIGIAAAIATERGARRIVLVSGFAAAALYCLAQVLGRLLKAQGHSATE